MAEAKSDAQRQLLFARVIARLVSLRHAGVLHRACDVAVVGRPHAPLAAMLWDWARLLDDAQRLITEVFGPSLREPGRLHQRNATEQRGRPSGAVHWPHTTRLAMHGGHVGPPRFVCTTAERSLLAPENLLLIWTLDEFLSHALTITARVEASALLGADDRELFRRFRHDVRQALIAPWVSACRETIHELRRAGARAEAELELAVQERVRGRPSAAPDWARSLLELRRAPLQIPEDAALAEIDDEQLWLRLAYLEMLALLRARTRVRQGSSNPDAFACPSGVAFEPLEQVPASVIAGPKHATIGLLRTTEPDWRLVRRDAADSCFETRHADLDIDRWLIIHRAAQSPITHTYERHGIELFYWHLDANAGPPPELLHTLTRWLPSS
jgi:hypothetical protein